MATFTVLPESTAATMNAQDTVNNIVGRTMGFFERLATEIVHVGGAILGLSKDHDHAHIGETDAMCYVLSIAFIGIALISCFRAISMAVHIREKVRPEYLHVKRHVESNKGTTRERPTASRAWWHPWFSWVGQTNSRFKKTQ
jgi:hypothetical protein